MRISFAKSFSLLITFIFLTISFIFNPTQVFAVTFSNDFSNSSSAPALSPCPDSIAPLGCGGTACWNSWAVGQTDCGTSCPPGNGGQAWTKYSYSGCYLDPNSSITDPSCINWFSFSQDTCSTGDKYNSGNPPVLNAGFCDCSPGGSYKTCCSAGSTVNANHYQVDPYNPDEADCGGATTVRCGGGGQPACGQAACTIAPPPPTPPPTPIPTVGPCPTTAGWEGGPCTQGTTNVAEACSTSSNCNTCSVKSCVLYTGVTYCWYNSSACYNDPNFCSGIGNCAGKICTPGTQQTLCGTTNSCHQ